MFHGFKLLRVWDLENPQIGKLPGSEVNSFNYRYLNLTGNQVEQHPKSKLSKLEKTLAINETKIEEFWYAAHRQMPFMGCKFNFFVVVRDYG